MNDIYDIFNHISLKCVPLEPYDITPLRVQVMGWHRMGDIDLTNCDKRQLCKQ